MEHLLQRLGYRRVVGVHVHYVGHHVPPFLGDGIHVVGILRVTLACTLLIAKQYIGFLVPINTLVDHATVLNHLYQFGPDGSMPTLVFLFATGFQLHLKCKSFHNYVL